MTVKVPMLLILAVLVEQTTGAQLSDCKTIYRVEGKEAAYPRLSADNKRILYQHNESGKWHLRIMEIATAKHVEIASGSSNNNFPDWSADNEWIAFVSDRDGNEEIYMAKADGAGMKRVTTHGARDIHPYFSPDGRYLLFNSTRGNGSLDIFRYEIATGTTQQLSHTPDHETCARYSPDMGSIVFLRNNDEMDDIFLMDAKTLVTKNLTNTPFQTDGWPMFSNDGKWIYYSSMDPGIYCLFRMRADGTNRQQLSAATRGEEHARVYIAKEGDFLIFNSRSAGTIEIRSCRIGSED
jgi:Tol biopolymer transport system component